LSLLPLQRQSKGGNDKSKANKNKEVKARATVKNQLKKSNLSVS
jgi:hypothetical protein